MMSLGALSTLVMIAVGITVLTPVLLLVLVIRDLQRGELW
ncbi:hypothetical protein P886_4865 [Alteromonadaceae bacterium 2753L.S.0a.02]|nr:hypothetical protein P886_4865 [Alteromonadaceae bacterium 2753L.S.0a.02]